MGNLLTDDIKTIYRQYVADIKHDFTRVPINVVWIENSAECPNCKYDSVNKCSAGKVKPSGIAFSGACPVCSGRGKIVNSGRIALSGTIYYQSLSSNLAEQEAGGRYDESACELSCLISECICQSGVFAGKSYFDFCSYIEFDDRKWIVEGKPIPGGLGENFTLTINVKKTNKVI